MLALEVVADHPMSRKNGDRILGRYYSDSLWREFFGRHGLVEILHRSDGVSSSMFLLRKRVEIVTPPAVINMDDLNCSWLEEVKAKYSDLENGPEDARLWLVGKSDCNGMLGFFNCLRREPGSDKVRCVQVANLNRPDAKLPDLSPDGAEFKRLAEMDLAFNVYRDEQWGAYRHLAITDGELCDACLQLGESNFVELCHSRAKKKYVYRNKKNSSKIILIDLYLISFSISKINQSSGNLCLISIA